MVSAETKVAKGRGLRPQRLRVGGMLAGRSNRLVNRPGGRSTGFQVLLRAAVRRAQKTKKESLAFPYVVVFLLFCDIRANAIMHG